MTMQSWWPQSSAWLNSDAAKFLFFNVLVGVVAVMSRAQQRGAAQRGRRLCRSASSMLLARLRSFSSFVFLPATAEWYYHHTTAEAGELHVAEAVRAPKHEHQAVMPEPAPAAEPRNVPAGALSSSSTPEANTDEQAEEKCDEPTVVVAKGAPEESSSSTCTRRRARACRREAEVPLLELEGKADLNARAELFICQFREDLKLQRLNSIINYTRELRRRAAGAAALLPQD